MCFKARICHLVCGCFFRFPRFGFNKFGEASLRIKAVFGLGQKIVIEPELALLSSVYNDIKWQPIYIIFDHILMVSQL